MAQIPFSFRVEEDEEIISLSSFGSTQTTTPLTTKKGLLFDAAKIVFSTGKTLVEGLATKEGRRLFSEGFIEGTPQAVGGFQRGGAIFSKKVGEGVKKILNVLNLPGQLTEFVTSGKMKAPEA